MLDGALAAARASAEPWALGAAHVAGDRALVLPHFLAAEEVEALAGVLLDRSWEGETAGWEQGADTPEYCCLWVRPEDDPSGVVEQVERRAATLTGTAPHESEDALKLSAHTAARRGTSARHGSVLFNLHHDIQPVRPRRTHTLIVYLDCAGLEGGETFVCLPGPGSSLAADLQELFESGVTRLPVDPYASEPASPAADRSLAEAEARVERLRAARTDGGALVMDVPGEGLLITPRAGAAFLFTSRLADGRPDASGAWHGAANVLAGVKLAAQKFKAEPA